MVVTYVSIGRIRSPFRDASSVPGDTAALSGVAGTVEIDAKYADELRGIEMFSHLMLVYHFHLSSIYAPAPAHNGPRPGLFATRSADRVNHIGVSVVRLLRRERNVLHIEDVDVVDGTPLLDVKPYVPAMDVRQDAA